jgi:hypothetical protein
MTNPSVERFLWFIKERYNILQKRRAGLPKPWTDDPILQSYRFCNVFREDDTETMWLAENWRTPNKNDPDFWFAALVFRLTNWHETAEELGYPVPWNPIKFMGVIEHRLAQGKKTFSGAYMITTHTTKMPKSKYLARSLTKIWERREEIRPRQKDSLSYFCNRLISCFDISGFLAGQVIADAKYATPHLEKAPDWWDFVVSGPGSRRGLNRLLGQDTNTACRESDFQHYVGLLLGGHIDEFLEDQGIPRMHAQDVQNCLCEFDKYERVRLGEGRPKQRYNGGAE